MGFQLIPKLMTLNDVERRGIRDNRMGCFMYWAAKLYAWLGEGGLAGRQHKVNHKVINHHNGRYFASFHRMNLVALGADYAIVGQKCSPEKLVSGNI